MALNVTGKIVNQVAEITLAGDLDESTAPLFHAELVKAADHQATRLVLYLCGLVFSTSAAVRELLFMQQKKKWKPDIYVIAPQQQFLDLLKRVCMMNSVIIQSEYKP